MKPFLSFIVPAFNSGAYLREAVESIRSQVAGITTAEIIVVDDCSTDTATLRVLETLAGEPATRCLRQPRNSGPAATRNTGLFAASGEWICFLDSDDTLAPGAIEARLAVVAAVPEAAWIMGDLLRVNRPGQFDNGDFPAFVDSGEPVFPGVVLHERAAPVLLRSARTPYVGTAMIRRGLIGRAGGFEPALRYSEDWLLWLTLSMSAPLYWMTRPTVHVRRYHASMTKDLLAGATAAPLAPRMALRNPLFAALRKPLRWRLSQEWRRYSEVHRAYGLRLAAIHGALQSVRWTPNDVRSYRALAAALTGAYGASSARRA